MKRKTNGSASTYNVELKSSHARKTGVKAGCGVKCSSSMREIVMPLNVRLLTRYMAVVRSTCAHAMVVVSTPVVATPATTAHAKIASASPHDSATSPFSYLVELSSSSCFVVLREDVEPDADRADVPERKPDELDATSSSSPPPSSFAIGDRDALYIRDAII